MALVEQEYASFREGGITFYYTSNTTNNRISSARCVNNTDLWCAIRLEYRTQVFRDVVVPQSTKTWDISGQWGNASMDEIQLGAEASIQPL